MGTVGAGAYQRVNEPGIINQIIDMEVAAILSTFWVVNIGIHIELPSVFGALYVGGSYKGYFGTNFPQGWCLSLPTSSPLRKNKENCCKIPSGCGGNSYRLRLTNEQALLSMQPTNTQCSHEISVGVLGNIHTVVTRTIETSPGTQHVFNSEK